ncbi:hypothetical protein BGZ93_007108 [Podila epicladia]|nr:hypothetical protein BGZ92_011383 [Podila epicladia]KAG0094524.1 hypothetical protein BGZ93_007108 [Podila epicladia]
MSDDNTNATGAGVTSVDPVHQLLQSSNNGQPMTAEQRNDRREALLKRQKEAREKAQQISQAAKANAIAPSSSSAPASTPAPSPSTPPVTTAALVTPVAPVAPVVSDAPVRENMVQQAVSFLSSPSVQSADEAKKTQFLEKKGLTLKEIELARSRVAGGASGSSELPPTVSTPAPVAPTNYNNAPPPVPPRTYTPTQAYPPQQVAYYPPPQQVAPVDPKAFQKKLVLALLISGGVTALTSVIVQKLIYPMVRGITGARRSLVGSQTELLAKLKERLTSYKDYLLGLNLGSNHRRPTIKQLKDVDEKKDTKTTVEDEDDDLKKSSKATTTITTTTTTTVPTYQSTIKQLDNFSKTLEDRAKEMSFEQLKATRAMTQDLAEYITKETYALTTSIAYPTSRYYGYNASGAASSGKGGLNDPTTPESALKSEIRSLKGLLLNWRNFPTAATATSAPGSPSMPVGPSLVQQQ